ncbi:uncharacterized protein BO88DRAFT_408816 [Aspergillus vadensis CBS 113365]|uniref:Uncharacterized protein n=1 Tax=Aspergillus vadensis (strain CBS 113365 / IMI 142717 / IBT 24658) TaxID=1448311 RepID=A0A319BD84_ASPVC|nr:hypothetical protein BO88DRAFT_408816 [Aspergillus vadensis CBS 113365]PYH63973.1 hypothetical protein BO88DRAFT_408816 [Aspergillus vadensis CBS 113365]
MDMPVLENPGLGLFDVKGLLIHRLNQQLAEYNRGLALDLGASRSAILADEDGAHGAVCEDVGPVFCSFHAS